jgi:hypothetical protein
MTALLNVQLTLDCVVRFTEQHELDVYLIPMTVLKTPNTFFVDRDYVGRERKPEYGLHLSTRNRAKLEPYRFVSSRVSTQTAFFARDTSRPVSRRTGPGRDYSRCRTESANPNQRVATIREG